jgi:hypothetical protein
MHDQSDVLPELCKVLRGSIPDVRVELVVTNSVSNLLQREADIALRMVQQLALHQGLPLYCDKCISEIGSSEADSTAGLANCYYTFAILAYKL